jgi:N-hydroxyarylamine O-acetyltransferase
VCCRSATSARCRSRISASTSASRSSSTSTRCPTRSCAVGAAASATSSTVSSRPCWENWASTPHSTPRRVFRPDGTLGPPFDHAAIRVELDEPWLVDVGFGRFSRFPLRLTAPEAQADPEGEFLFLDAPYGDIDVLLDGKPQYRLEQRPRDLAEFVPTAWWQATSPESHFVRGPACSRPNRNGRVTLAGDKLIVTTGGERQETVLSSDREILDAYRKEFGIDLDRVPVQP